MSKISSAEYKANSSLLGFVEAPLIFERSSESLLFACLPDFFRKRVQRYDISANWQNNFPTFFIKTATFFRQCSYKHLKRGWQRAQTKTTLCKPNRKLSIFPLNLCSSSILPQLLPFLYIFVSLYQSFCPLFIPKAPTPLPLGRGVVTMKPRRGDRTKDRV